MTGVVQVLYVDDELEFLQMGKTLLEKGGRFEVTTCTSPTEAIMLLKKRSFHVILSGYHMPVMNGISLLRQLRSDHNKTPFILCTGKGTEDVVMDALQYGATAYIPKRGDINTIFSEISKKIDEITRDLPMNISENGKGIQLDDIINFLPDATLAIDAKGTVIVWNKAIEEMTGVPAIYMIGKGNYEYAIPFYGERRPILIDLIFRPPEEVRERYSNIIQTGKILAAKTALPHTKGIVTTLWGIASPLFDKKGNVIGAIESIRDISEKESTEKRLGESIERYRTLAESSHDIIYIIDKDDRIVYLNTITSIRLGYPKKDIIGRFRSHFFHETPVDNQKKSIEKVFSSGESLRIESRMTLKDDNTWQDTLYIPLKNYDGEVIEVMAVARDVTERHEAEKTSRQSYDELKTSVKERTKELERLYFDLEDRIKERTAELTATEEAYREANTKLNLLNNITRHDIMNQLTSLNGYLELMRESLHTPELLSELIQKEQHIANTIRNQIEFTRYYQNVGVVDPIWHNIKKTVDSAIKYLNMKNIEVKMDRYDLEIFADPLFEKVIYNLVDNSLRYGGESLTQILISWYITDFGLCVVFEDNGAGIINSDKKKIFERGFGKNTGFGLFLAKEILGITGISIQETGVFGEGARFEMMVPDGIFRMPHPENR